MRSVLLPVQEGFASAVLARGGSGRILHGAGLRRVSPFPAATEATRPRSPRLPARPGLGEGWGRGQEGRRCELL